MKRQLEGMRQRSFQTQNVFNPFLRRHARHRHPRADQNSPFNKRISRRDIRQVKRIRLVVRSGKRDSIQHRFGFLLVSRQWHDDITITTRLEKGGILRTDQLQLDN